MGYIDRKWAPLIMITVINTINGMVNALIKKVLDGGIDHMGEFDAIFLFAWPPRYTSATLGSAFWGTLPAITFIMALIFRLDKLNMKTKAGYGVVLGAMISLAGALTLTIYQGVPLSNSHEHATILNIHNGHENWIKGCFLLFIGVILFSSWMLIQANINSSYPCPYSSTVILSVFGTLQCALLSLIKTRHVEDWILRDKLTIITVIIAGVAAQGMCTVGISWCIKQRGPVFTSAFSPVTLMSATVFDFLILHRMIYLGSVIGSVVVVIGLYIFLWSKSKQIVECKIVKLPTSTVKEEKDEEDHTNVNKIGRHLVIPMTP
ncbi:hypothetical protein YC2023_037888 [Brassica napus]